MATQTTDWDISTDIYGITESLNNLKKRYIPDESESTLALGIFGYVTDTEAKKIQTSVIMTGELGNEMFPARAKLSKNVLTHAIYSDIQDINAVPSVMTLNIGIKVEDFERYSLANRFIIDSKFPIFVGEYEFHFDYDLILIRSESPNGSFVYSAHYDMSEPNRLSDITDPYLKQPFVMKIDNDFYIIFQANLRQITVEEIKDRIIKDSIIDNKTYTFEFENQLADFEVYIEENDKVTKLRPVPYNSSTEGTDLYCWYLFITDNTIRITFDTKSFIPGLNAKIYIKTYTTLGESGKFNYTKVDETYNGFFTELSSDKYNYDKIVCYVVATTDSRNGKDRKTTENLRQLIPKAALSRGSLTTDADIDNYFNIIDTETNRMKMMKKVDNQKSRIWYGYFLLKDESNNIIPTNSIKLEIDVNDTSMCIKEGSRYILPAGAILKYDPHTMIAKVCDESEVPELFSDEYFSNDAYYYMTVYNTIINVDPLYAAFYLTISNTNSFFEFEWVNENVDMQFIAPTNNFQRNLLVDQQIYKFSFKMAQSISSDFGLYEEEDIEETDSQGNPVNRTVVTNNMKCILVLYNDDKPYRWTEATMTEYDETTFRSSWNIEMETDNSMDNTNKIRINNLHVAGYSSAMSNYGFFETNTKAVLYILAKFKDGDFGRKDLDEIAPGFEGWSVTNIYSVAGGINFFENFTGVLCSKVTVDDNDQSLYQVTGIPVVGLHYMTTPRQSEYLINAISEKKAYIDYCLKLLENSMDIDFKFFNTYGPSSTYSIGDKANTMIGHVDLSIKGKLSIKSTSDMYTRDDVIQFIKEYFENIQNIGDWHSGNMITDIHNTFADRINYFEYTNFNDFWLGVQSITEIRVDDPHIVPEFINIRNRYNIEGELEPCIDIEVV